MLPSRLRPKPLSSSSFSLLAVACFVLFGTGSGCQSDGRRATGSLVYVGTGSGKPDEGIYTLRFDSTTGALEQAQPVTPLLNPTYLTMGRDGDHLYSVRETTDSATVHSFAVNDSTGDLTPLNSVSAEGGAPCYISVDESGQWVLTANYVGGNVAVFPVQESGRLGPAAQVVQHTGSGPNAERQSSSHAHYFRVGPGNQHAFAANLGTDEVRIYPFDAEEGPLDTTNVRVVPTQPGMGPRHLAFHPDGRHVYLVGELSGTVTTFEFDADAGQMKPIQTVSTVPDDFDGAARSAAIHVHPSGDYLYASNRGDANNIAAYRIEEETGSLEIVGHYGTNVRWPRSFTIDPSGQYLLVANRRGDSITVFRIDGATGELMPTDHAVDIPSPTKITFAQSSSD